MWETWVRSLGREDPLEKEVATHSSILAWRRSLVGYSPRGRKESDTTERLHFPFPTCPTETLVTSNKNDNTSQMGVIGEVPKIIFHDLVKLLSCNCWSKILPCSWSVSHWLRDAPSVLIRTIIKGKFVAPWTVPRQALCPWDFPGNSTGVDWHNYFVLFEYSLRYGSLSFSTSYSYELNYFP